MVPFSGGIYMIFTVEPLVDFSSTYLSADHGRDEAVHPTSDSLHTF